MIYPKLKCRKLHKKEAERKTIALYDDFLPQVNSLSWRDR